MQKAWASASQEHIYIITNLAKNYYIKKAIPLRILRKTLLRSEFIQYFFCYHIIA